MRHPFATCLGVGLAVSNVVYRILLRHPLQEWLR